MKLAWCATSDSFDGAEYKLRGRVWGLLVHWRVCSSALETLAARGLANSSKLRLKSTIEALYETN